jgi:hypothetical protein
MSSSKSLRHGLLALVALAAGLAGASCSSLIGAEEYEDSGEAICEMMSYCYSEQDPSCARRVQQRLELSPRAIRSKWLSQLTDASCLQNCVAARKCLDLEPVCRKKAEECTRREHCCDFLNGTVACDGNCCGARGASCTDDSDCCEGTGGCVQPFGTCGGVICRQLEAKCLNDFDCCSNNCGPDGRCAEICSEIHCTQNADCCVGSCDSGRCTKCKPEGAVCQPGGTNEQACCASPESPLTCVETPDGLSRCGSQAGCMPPGAECVSSDRCCDEAPCVNGLCSKACGLPGAACAEGEQPCCNSECTNGVCAKTCADEGAGCASSLDCCSGVCDAGTCACSDDWCNSDDNCCNGVCIGGACKPPCAPIDCQHSVCKLGAPMDASCGKDCIDQICLQDEYCCCGAWDALCVKLAFELECTC